MYGITYIQHKLSNCVLKTRAYLRGGGGGWFRGFNNNVTDDLLNYELSKICDWLGANKLALNVSKTKFMVFHTVNKHVIYLILNINGNNTERVTNLNFLGLTLSSTLSWKHHIDKISLNISKSIGTLYRLRDIYPRAAF